MYLRFCLSLALWLAGTTAADAAEISQAALQADLRQHLLQQGMPEDHELTIQFSGKPLVTPDQATDSGAPAYRLSQVMYNPLRGRFSAHLIVGSGETRAQRRKITGHSYQVIDMPVLRHMVHRHNIIQESDIDWIRVPAKRLPRAAISTVEGLIDKVARRLLPAGQPINRRDVRPNFLVQKNNAVTITLTAPGLHLSTLGKAQDAGILGDVVSVKNTASGRIVDAVVIGADRVQVGSLQQ